MNYLNSFKNRFLVFFLLLLVLFSINVFSSGTWFLVEPSLDTYCSPSNHVMCSEYGVGYNPLTGLIPYSDRSSGGDGRYCVIYKNTNFFDTPTFGFIKNTNITSYKNLTTSGLLPIEVFSQIDLGAGARHYDFNCNGFELFPRVNDDSSQFLDLSKYMENAITYSIENKSSNIDNFDILALDDSGNLLNHGSYITGRFIESGTALGIAGVNLTLYFSNPSGELIPYLSFLSDSNGIFTTLVPRNIESLARNYSNVRMIPRTKYILIASHPNYVSFQTQIDLTNAPSINNSFYMQPFGVCQSDCTFAGSNVCRSDCHGINGCEFKSITSEPDSLGYVRNFLDLKPKGIVFDFNYTLASETTSTKFLVESCDAEPISASSVIETLSEGVICKDPSMSSTKVERTVFYNNQVVKLILTVCQ